MTAVAQSHPSEDIVPAPSEAPVESSVVRSEPDPRRLVGALLLIAFLPRVFVFLFAENLYGDSVVRTELGLRWLEDPRIITSFSDGAYQFGPLHVYLSALAVKLWPAKEHALRAVSLLFGTLTVLPLFALTRRMFGWRSAVWACLALSAWGMHLQFSTTAASEAVALFLTVWLISAFAEAWQDGHLGAVVVCALVLNLACATRYELWLLIPLLALLLATQRTDRIAALTRAIVFGFFCLPFPLLWMQGNELAHGDPLYPVNFISQFHEQWVGPEMSRWGEPAFRLQNVVFWPATALVTLTPLVALFAFVGMWRTWRETPQHRWLLWVVLVPTAVFAFKGAVLLDFVPLARFTGVQLLLTLPFVLVGFEKLTRGWGGFARKTLATVAIVPALVFPTWLGIYTHRSDAPLARTLRPISPVTTHPPQMMRVVAFLEEIVMPLAGSVVLDAAPHYMDLQIAFFSGLPDERFARVRWNNFEKRLTEVDPVWLVRVEGGELEKRGDVKIDGASLRLGHRLYDEVPGFAKPYHVYRRR